MKKKVRVRFAPSPTGPLHIGGVRTALYNYLFAKKNGGDFLLRLEDTDQTRFVPGAEAYIVESLKWCGIIPDEGVGFGGDYGPYRQSERKESGIYKQYVDQLVENDYAYYAFDTPEELETMRDNLKKAGVAAPQYNATTRNSMKNSLTLPAEEVERRIASGDPYVVRIKIPRNEEIKFKDLIRGWVVVHSSNLDDKVLYKADGMPTYHMANVVDDHLMKITHVIRGEEWLPSGPLHVLLYRYLGWEDEMPEFAHLPLILKPDGNGKLSKRDGDRLGFPVFPLDWKTAEGEIYTGYREQGYFPEAFINMLALLGWNPGTSQEIFSMEELINAFSLERVGKSGSKFDPDKTKWFNQQYLRKKSNAELAKLLVPYLEKEGISVIDLSYVEKVCELMKERASFVKDMLEGIYLFKSPESFDEKTFRKKWKDNTPEILIEFEQEVSKIELFTAENIETVFKNYLEQKGLGLGQVLPNLRLVLTGRGAGPSLFSIMELLGKEETLKRIKTGVELLVNG